MKQVHLIFITLVSLCSCSTNPVSVKTDSSHSKAIRAVASVSKIPSGLPDTTLIKAWLTKVIEDYTNNLNSDEIVELI